MPDKFRYPAAIVTWDDASARNQAVEYLDTEAIQYHKAERCQTLGLVIKDDDTGISLYCEETGSDSIRGLSFIPRQLVVDVSYVKLTKVRATKAVPSCPSSSSVLSPSS